MGWASKTTVLLDPSPAMKFQRLRSHSFTDGHNYNQNPEIHHKIHANVHCQLNAGTCHFFSLDRLGVNWIGDLTCNGLHQFKFPTRVTHKFCGVMRKHRVKSSLSEQSILSPSWRLLILSPVKLNSTTRTYGFQSAFFFLLQDCPC